MANDTYAVLRGTLSICPNDARQHWGVGVTCGTGINCVDLPDGGRRFLPGRNPAELGRWRRRGRSGDPRPRRTTQGGPHTALRPGPAPFGPVARRCVAHLGNVSYRELASLSPVIFRTADSGDEVARSLVLRQAEEIFLLARSAIRRLDLADTAVTVVLGGGIVAARYPLLIDWVTDMITTEFQRS